MSHPGVGFEEQVLLALRRIARAASLHSRRIQHVYGLTTPQLFVLRELERRGGATGAEVARLARLSQATVAGILDRLERRGLVRRTRSVVDKRRLLAQVTEAGRALLAAAPSPLQARFLDRFRELQDWEQSFLVGALQRVAGMMEEPEAETGWGAAGAPPELDVDELETVAFAGAESPEPGAPHRGCPEAKAGTNRKE